MKNRALLIIVLIISLTVMMLSGCTASTPTTTTAANKTTASTTIYDGTYAGKFYYKHPANDSVEYKNIEWIEDSFTLTLTFKTRNITDNKVVILDITKISCSDPRFGDGVPTNFNEVYHSVAYLPLNPSTQLVNNSAYGITVYFTNGELNISNSGVHNGDLIVSSDGITLSNSPASIGTEANRIQSRPWNALNSYNENLLFNSWPKWGWYAVNYVLTQISN